MREQSRLLGCQCGISVVEEIGTGLSKFQGIGHGGDTGNAGGVAGGTGAFPGGCDGKVQRAARGQAVRYRGTLR